MGDQSEEKITFPQSGQINFDWILKFGRVLESATWKLPPSSLPDVLPVDVADSILLSAYRLLHREPNILEVQKGRLKNGKVVIVGDVHGQFHDVLKLFETLGLPNGDDVYVFNGDYVDRGAWGVETYLYLLTWKLAYPTQILLLRGNHETKYCVSYYGFETELRTKFGSDASHLFRRFLACFESHPLAALIADTVFTCHGGLFREQSRESQTSRRGKKGGVKGGKGAQSGGRGKKRAELSLGSLKDLAKARRSFLDPHGTGSSTIAADVLWSDPGKKLGLSLNTTRGIGLVFGPDYTQEFLVHNKLKLIIRSHEGPDAREKRKEMGPMKDGYSIDHDVPSGKLITLFSAPDYPQFQETSQRYNNQGAYIVLSNPDFTDPVFHSFTAVLPRPKVEAYYDYITGLDSDEDLGLNGGSDASTDGSDFEEEP